MWGLVMGLLPIVVGNASPAWACGIGQPATMEANGVPALAFPIVARHTSQAPLGIFPFDGVVGQPITFTENIAGLPASFDPQAYRWRWQFGDGSSSIGLSVTHRYRQSGDMIIQVGLLSKTSNDLVTPLFDSVQLHISNRAFTQPPVVMATSSNTFVQVGQSLQYSAVGSYASAGGPLVFTWNFGDGQTAQGMTVSHTFTQVGKGIVGLIVQDRRGARAYVTFAITVALQLPHPQIVVMTPLDTNRAILFTGAATAPDQQPFADYLWNFGDGQQWESPTAQTSHRYAHPGTYQVTLQVTDIQGNPGSVSRWITITAPPATTPARAAFPFLLVALLVGVSLLGWLFIRRRMVAR
jgi:PKD repeat protein